MTRPTRIPLLGLACAALGATACAHTDRAFPLRPPVWQDSDLRPVTVACHAEPSPKDPRHVSCAPEVQFSPILWDGIDNLLFRPMSESLGVEVGGEALGVNSLDEVPDSSWFVNRLGVKPMPPGELAKGACDDGHLLDPAADADGSWVIDKGKGEGSTSGFRVTIAGKGKYLIKLEPSDQPERPSAASVVGSAVYHAAGYRTTCEQILYIRPSLLKLEPGLRYKGNFGEEKDFDRATLERFLAEVPRRGALLRVQASAWLPGYPLGPFRYEGLRRDDPNDVIAHERRRDLRGLRLLDAWIGRVDARSANTYDAWVADAPGAAPDSSPGHVVHEHLDTSECLGSEWDWNEISRRLGYSYVLDWGDLGADFVSLGIPTRTWDTVRRAPGREIFGYFDVEHFVPDQWKMEYPNAAFSRMTERDGAWMARILARFTPELVHTLASMAQFSDPGQTAYLEQVLRGRLARLLERYLTRLSPVADVHVEGPSEVCGVDLAERALLREPARFQYAARVRGGPSLTVTRRAGGEVCVTLPHVAPDDGPPPGDASRRVRAVLSDGVAAGPLVLHLYDLGPTGGYRLAGLERPER